MKKTCCCCFYNSVRSLILILSFFCVVSLFANILLLNFAAIYNDEFLPKHFFPFQNQGIATIAPSEFLLNNSRFRRDLTVNDTEDEPMPIITDDTTQELILEIQKIDKPILSKKSAIETDEGHPIVEESAENIIFTFPTMAPNTRRIVLTRPTTANIEKVDETEMNSTIFPSEVTKRSAKKFVLKDKDQINDENKELNSKFPISFASADFSGISIFERVWMDEIFDWLYFAAPGIGMLFFHFPSNYFIRSLGSHRVIFACLIISAISTALIPFVFKMGQLVLTAIRLIQGLTFSPVFSFLGQNTAVWAALKEQLWFLCTCIAAIILTPAISWSLSNQIFSNGGFDMVFFVHGGFSLFLAFVWLIFYRDAPQKHRWVNGLELNKIVTGKAQKNRVMERNSIILIFKSISVISIWFSAFGYFFAFAVFSIFLPIYSNKVLHLTTYSAGTFSVIPFILMAFVHWIGYLLNKIINCCGLTVKVRIFNTISLAFCATYFLGLAVAAAIHGNQNYSTFHMVLHYGALVPLGLAIIGFYQSCVVVGRFFSQFILSHVQIVFSLVFILVPAIVVFWTPLNILRYWRIIFVVTAAVLILSTVVFAVFGSGQPAHWAENSWDPTATHRMLQPIRMAKDAECGILEMRTVDDYLKSLNE